MAEGDFIAGPAHAHRGAVDRLFWAKSRTLIGQRMLRNAADRQRRLHRAGPMPECETLAADVSTLYTALDPRERELELGKVQNLRVAAAAIDGLLLAPGDVLSFWRAVGRPTRTKGYVVGRELRQGCMIPTVAGGICQLSNALSRVASTAGMTIVERHRHSAAVDGPVIDDATDATVFWNYIDFRFRATRRVRISATLTESDLVVRLEAAG
jgi:vancomycin resistance protein YoaR